MGLWTARTVNDHQITFLLSRDTNQINNLPENCELGGISGGPILGVFETDSYVWFCRLSGIVTEHPNYENSDFSVERIVGCRADFSTESGFIR